MENQSENNKNLDQVTQEEVKIVKTDVNAKDGPDEFGNDPSRQDFAIFLVRHPDDLNIANFRMTV